PAITSFPPASRSAGSSFKHWHQSRSKYFERMKITVTKNDIRRGIMNSSTSCPVALAVKRATKDSTATVGWAFIHIRHGITFDWELRGEVLKLVREFDKGYRVRPLSFTLPIKKVGRKFIRTKEVK